MSNGNVTQQTNTGRKTKEIRVKKPLKKSWIEIELVDNENQFVPNERYKIIFPDGSEKTDNLDANGYARIENIDYGRCSITFIKTIHTVKKGESLSKIANSYGFRGWQKIYNCQTKEFKSKHPNPDLIYPGDKIFVPYKEIIEKICKTEEKHKFRITGFIIIEKINWESLSDKEKIIVSYKIRGLSKKRVYIEISSEYFLINRIAKFELLEDEKNNGRHTINFVNISYKKENKWWVFPRCGKYAIRIYDNDEMNSYKVEIPIRHNAIDLIKMAEETINVDSPIKQYLTKKDFDKFVRESMTDFFKGGCIKIIDKFFRDLEKVKKQNFNFGKFETHVGFCHSFVNAVELSDQQKYTFKLHTLADLIYSSDLTEDVIKDFVNVHSILSSIYLNNIRDEYERLYHMSEKDREADRKWWVGRFNKDISAINKDIRGINKILEREKGITFAEFITNYNFEIFSMPPKKNEGKKKVFPEFDSGEFGDRLIDL